MLSNIQKKLEKLASAVYLLTSFFADAEPLKWKLRALGADLVSAGHYLKDNHSGESTRAGIEIRGMVEEVLSQLEVTKNAGLISPSNHTLIVDEFKNLLGILELPKGFISSPDGAILSSNFFAPQLKPREVDPEKIDEDDEEYVKDKNNSDLLALRAERNFQAPDQNISKGQTSSEAPAQPRSLKDFSPVSVKKNSRRSIIINLLKRKKEIMIKDVSPLISGCSEKTIQRELLAMVDAGILKKVGEKRWSRYSLL